MHNDLFVESLEFFKNFIYTLFFYTDLDIAVSVLEIWYRNYTGIYCYKTLYFFWGGGGGVLQIKQIFHTLVIYFLIQKLVKKNPKNHDCKLC